MAGSRRAVGPQAAWGLRSHAASALHAILWAMLLLLNPPSPDGAVANREGVAGYGTLSAGFAYPPHTLAVVAAACRQAGLEVRVLDAVGERLDLAATAARIGAVAPDLLALFASRTTLAADCATLSHLRPLFPCLPIVAIGAGARFDAEALLAAQASHVLLGDPDLALARLVGEALPPSGVVRVRDLLPDQHNHAGLVRDPSLLPRPAWDVVPWQRYGFLSLSTARGCDDTCSFCAYIAAQGRSFRSRPAGDVVAEMLWLQRSFSPPRILVRDLVFAADRARAMAIARQLAVTGFRTAWECESRPEHFDPVLLRQMAKAGCSVIKLGVETTDPDLLVKLERIDLAQEAAHYLASIRRVLTDARRYGIQTRVFVLAGLPGQTAAHARATAHFLRQARPDFVHPRLYTAYPHVPLGQTTPPADLDDQLHQLEAVAAECQTRSSRPPSLISRLRRLYRRMTSF